MLTKEEIELWEKRIPHSKNYKLIRDFYRKLGKEELIPAIFRDDAKDFVDLESIFDERVRGKVYEPEISCIELYAMGADSLRKDVRDKDFGDFFGKLAYSSYKSPFSREEMRKIVHDALASEPQGEDDGHHLKLWLLQSAYKHHIPAALKKKVLADIVFESLANGSFNKAEAVQKEHGEVSLSSFPTWFKREFENNRIYIDNPARYFIEAYCSQFRHLYEQVFSNEDVPHLSTVKDVADFITAARPMQPTSEMDRFVASTDSEFLLEKYNKRKGLPNSSDYSIFRWEERLAEERTPEGKLATAAHYLYEFWGSNAAIGSLSLLLKDKKFMRGYPHDLNTALTQRITAAMNEGHAHEVYELFHGINMGNINYGTKGREKGVPGLMHLVPVDETALLERMIHDIKDTPEEVLSSKHSFKYDNLTSSGTAAIDDAYTLLCSLRRRQKPLPAKKAIDSLVFLKMAVHAKENYEGNGMREILRVYKNHNNNPHIDRKQMRALFTKVIQEGFEEGRVGGVLGHENITNFYLLTGSPLGEIMKDNQYLQPYYRLHAFLSTSQKV